VAILRAYSTLASWLARNIRVLIGCCILYAAAALLTDRLIGGRAAFVAGNILAIVVVTYLLVAVIVLLFQPYKGRVGAFFRLTPMQVISATLCSVAAVFAFLVVFQIVKGIWRGFR
jgi:hypothetical protein